MTAKGITETGSILDRIVADKRDDLERRKTSVSQAELLSRAEAYDQCWTLSQAIVTPRGKAPVGVRVQVVAEIKKASPSKGVLAADLDYLNVAAAYTEAGAAGISVLTETNYFLGSLDWLRDIRLRLQERYPVERPSLLRKDFVTEAYEVAEARAYGADNVLLIVALLETPLLRDLIGFATELGLDALVEVHNEEEAARAVEAGTRLFGINNRDLHTFEVDLATTERIRPLLPAGTVVIGESGVHTKADSQRLSAAGVQAILVGEAFMTSPDVGAKMAELRI
jgi:indole-3-glycerol phosphate synthase